MRLQHVDIARGLCMLLVVLGHNSTLVPPESTLHGVLGVVRMPLLFFIAGSFFNAERAVRVVARRKADALLKPFAVMVLLHAPARLLWWDASPLQYVLGALTGSGNYLPWLYTLWFLPHLWLVFIAAGALAHCARVCQLSRIESALALTMLMMVGHQFIPMFWMQNILVGDWSFTMQGLPLSADLLPLTLFFFCAGAMMRKPMRTLHFRWQGMLVSLATLGLVYGLYAPHIDLLGRTYDRLMACTVAALAGISCVLHLAAGLQCLPRVARWLGYCGYNSLFILLFHSPIQHQSDLLLQRVLGTGPRWWTGAIAWALSVAGALVLARVIRQRAWLRVLFLPTRSPHSRALPASKEQVMPMPGSPAAMGREASGDEVLGQKAA